MVALRFGIFYEHQLPRPWGDGAEERLYRDASRSVSATARASSGRYQREPVTRDRSKAFTGHMIPAADRRLPTVTTHRAYR